MSALYSSSLKNEMNACILEQLNQESEIRYSLNMRYAIF